MSIFIKIDILKPSLIKHLKKKMSTFIKVEQKSGDYTIIIIVGLLEKLNRKGEKS
jgi:hypothetical protein